MYNKWYNILKINVYHEQTGNISISADQWLWESAGIVRHTTDIEEGKSLIIFRQYAVVFLWRM